MLRKLSISNYVLIDSLDIEFPNGLIIISGETGAGKSILLGALSLLLGAKADSTSLFDTSRNCIVEGEFAIKGNSKLKELVKSILESEEDIDDVTLRRLILPNGRSRSFINDQPISVSSLTTISTSLVDIHAQHEHLLLTDNNYQLSILDYYCQSNTELENYKELNSKLNLYKQELEYLVKEQEGKLKELEYKEFQLQKLEEAKLKEGELEDLEKEQALLASAEEMQLSIYSSLEQMRPMGGSFVQAFKEIEQALKKYEKCDPCFKEYTQRFEACRIECKDLEHELERRAEQIIVSPSRLAQVEERTALLYSLLKKFGVHSIEELLEIKSKIESEIDSVSINNTKKENLIKEISKLEIERERAANLLSKKRGSKREELARVLENKIRELQMPSAKFEIELTQTEQYGPSGKDSICFMFCANTGGKLSKIQKVASGGELSRIMLCLKWLMAQFTKMPTMIFDEIDTGVSGSIADKMGNLIGELGHRMQIFSITHLPQIASKGKTHLLVYKEIIDGKARTKLKNLTEEERVIEIARMLSGATLSDAAIENAKFLLKQ